MLHTSQSELFALNVCPWFSPLDGRNLSPVDQVTSQVHSGREGSGTELPEWRREKPLWQRQPQPMVSYVPHCRARPCYRNKKAHRDLSGAFACRDWGGARQQAPHASSQHTLSRWPGGPPSRSPTQPPQWPCPSPPHLTKVCSSDPLSGRSDRADRADRTFHLRGGYLHIKGKLSPVCGVELFVSGFLVTKLEETVPGSSPATR